MSPSTKPETDSLNVAVTVNGETFVGSETAVDKIIVGFIESYVLLRVAAAVFPFPAASVATLAATLIDTSP